MIPQELAKIQEIIEYCMERFSYHVSEECKEALAAEIYLEFEEDFELAWRYRGLE